MKINAVEALAPGVSARPAIRVEPDSALSGKKGLREPSPLFPKTGASRRSPLQVVILGLSITSSWGNGHATTYRGLARELNQRGHQVLFLERDLEWYASNRDLPEPAFCQAEIYHSVGDLKRRFAGAIRQADLVIVGSYVPDGILIGDWVTAMGRGVTAFYDIDTPVTLSLLARGECNYLSTRLIPRYHLYLSFTGGPTLDLLQEHYGSPMARPLYCSVDPLLYYPKELPLKWDVGYMGTYSQDRQPPLEKFLVEPAARWPRGRFVVAGPQYPETIRWPSNVQRIEHLSPREHCDFYNSQRYTLNITRADMIKAGYSPSVRLFEAAACGTPIISDYWPGLEQFFEIGNEILVAHTTEDALHFLKEIPEVERKTLGERARKAILSKHTASHRAFELESHVLQLIQSSRGGPRI